MTASRSTFQEHSAISGEARHNAGPGVAAGRVDARETAEGQEPWPTVEERFFRGFRHRPATTTRRATRTRRAVLFSPALRHVRRRPAEDSSRRRAIIELIGNN
ncbi:rab1 small GTP-binding protein [Trypanosoma cruzi]|nr:rab1 small GTP-binding protein [Trypanosoma cruzi]